MSQLIYITAGLMNSMLFSMMETPMSMGMILLMHTIIVCMITATLSQNTWFSYILFLVFLGGMLVLFIYMTSVASNNLFKKMNYMNMMMITIITMMVTIMMLIMDPTTLTMSTEETSLALPQSNKNINSSLFDYPMSIMTLIVVMYLFLTLIVVVKITESHMGPLRNKN